MKQHILNLSKDSMIYGVGSVITRFIGLITLPLFTAYLTPDEYGVLGMLALLTMVAQPVFNLGLSAAMGPGYFKNNDPNSKSKAVWTAFIINLMSISFLMLIAWNFPVILGKLVRLPAEYAPLVQFSLTGCALTILVTSLTQRVQFEKQARLFVIVTVITAITAISVSILTVVFLDLGVKGMVIGQVSGNIISFLAFLIIGLKATKPAVSFAMAKELLQLGLPLVPSFAFLFILMHGNKYLLESMMGLDAVGVYTIGFNLGMTIRIVTRGIATAWYPFYMSYMNRQSEARLIFGRIFTYYTIGVGALSLFFFIAAKPVVLILTDEAFHQSYLVVGLIASSHYFIGMYNMFLPGSYYKKEIYIQSIVQFFAVLLSLPFMYFSIHFLGILGAALGVTIGHFLMALFMYLWNNYRGNIYVKIKYEWRRIGIFSFVYVTIAGLFLLANRQSLMENLVLSVIGLFTVFFAVVQVLNHDEIKNVPYLKFWKI
jgi:O-antigen/teichoic acid export membrane protein